MIRVHEKGAFFRPALGKYSLSLECSQDGGRTTQEECGFGK
jgi:hypothetical protein